MRRGRLTRLGLLLGALTLAAGAAFQPWPWPGGVWMHYECSGHGRNRVCLVQWRPFPPRQPRCVRPGQAPICPPGRNR